MLCRVSWRYIFHMQVVLECCFKEIQGGQYSDPAKGFYIGKLWLYLFSRVPILVDKEKLTCS